MNNTKTRMNAIAVGTQRAMPLVLLALGGIAALFLSIRQAEALPAYARLFERQYQYRPSCVSCHVRGGGSQTTDYGRDFLRAGTNLRAF
ncbi:TPA: hypothetical protein EYP66_24400 [Candidatus Poribacteria bacterium]|nr:hypothetical protein [Candidatus Poribacteria bacterium]